MRRKYWLGMIGLVMVMVWAGLAGAAPVKVQKPVISDLPMVQASMAQGKIVVDGKLDESAWKKAGFKTSLSHYTSGKPILEKTEFAIVYDKDTMYIGVICHESQMAKVSTVNLADNLAVYNDDAIEIFLSPSEIANEDNYFHFCLNIEGYRYGDGLANTGFMVPWQVKTQKYKDYWTAEIAIPFSSIVSPMGNENYWRLNITRNEVPSGELSSWAKTNGSFHSPYYFGKLAGIDFDGNFIGHKQPITPLLVEGLTKVFNPELKVAQSYKEEPVVVIPQPVKMTTTGRDYLITPDTKIVIDDHGIAGHLQAARELAEEIKDISGLELAIIPLKDLPEKHYSNCIILGEPSTNNAVNEICQKFNLKVDAQTPGHEGYILRVFPGSVLVAGSDDAGTYYGVQSLKQLLRLIPGTKRIVVKGAEIWDKPYFAERWVHFYVDNESPLAHAKMINKIFAKYKYNNILMECERGIAWKSHPEIRNPYSVDPDKVRELVKYANQHYMKVTPMVGSLGHSEWMFRNGKNLDFVEDSTKPDCYCPLNPKSYEFLFSLYDEAIDIFNHPKYFHMGRDEHDLFHPFPSHPECKKIGNEALYYQDTLKVYDYLKSKNCRPIMWADIFWKASFRHLIPKLPKDLVMANWIYRPDYEYPSLDAYQKQGLSIIGCTWYRPDNIGRYSKYAAEHNINGMMYTTWAGVDKSSSVVEREYKQVMGYITQADYAWNPRLDYDPTHAKYSQHEPIHHMPYYVGKVLRETWYPREKTIPENRSGFSVDLHPYFNLSLVDTVKKPGFLRYGAGNDLSGLVKTAVNGEVHLMDHIHYQLANIQGQPGAIMLKGSTLSREFPESVQNITVGRKAKQLNFLNLAVYSCPTGKRIASYVIHYEDGTIKEISLVYGKDIASWLSWDTYFMGDIAWQGVTAKDQAIFIRSLKWTNPFPEKKIVSFDFKAGQPYVAPLLIAVTGIE